MALSPLGISTITRAMTLAKQFVEQIKPVLDELNVIYDSGGGLKSTIQQADLDAVTSFSGLTKGQLDDGMFVLTGTIHGDLVNGLTQLSQLAARSGG